jgi:cytidylate kinase
MLKDTDVDFSGGQVMLDGEPVEAFIRTPEVSETASASSAVLAIREKLVALQRAMGQRKSVVMDGRDIGTNVLKDAECKIYLDASPRVRAERRAKELAAKGLPCDIDAVEADIRQRDFRDMHREHNPLAKADDAAVIDSSYLTIEQVVSVMKAVIEERCR